MESQAEMLLNSVDDGICAVDRLGRVSFANPAAARILEAEPELLRGRTVHELLHGGAPEVDRCDQDCPLRRATERPRAVGEEIVYAASGRSFPAEYVLRPIFDDGRFSGSVLTFRDISRRFALDRRKNEFISTASHELRAPLTSIRGALGLLAGGMLGEFSEKASSLLRIALVNSDRLVRLINDILDLERIESGHAAIVVPPAAIGRDCASGGGFDAAGCGLRGREADLRYGPGGDRRRSR